MPSNAPCVRRCIACREHALKEELVRVCRSPEGRIFIDESGCADGRGVWIHPTEACIGQVVRKNRLNAAFGCAVPREVYDELSERV